MPLSAFLFDLDGTLLDTNEKHARGWERALDRFGYRVPAARVLLEIGKSGERVVPTLVGEEAEARHGQELRAAQGEAYQSIIGQEDVAVFPRAKALLEACRERGLKTALVTAASQDDLDNVLERAGIDFTEMVDAVVTDDDAEEGKPAPESVSTAIEKLELAPGQCAMVGDTPYDVLSARRAGALGVGVLTGAHSAAALQRAGARCSYEDTGALLEDLDGALRQLAPGKKPLTQAHLNGLMQEALDEAWAGLSKGEVPIGSVVTNGNGRVVGRAHNQARATGSRVAHAEMRALADAGHKLDLGAALVSTVEPCTMCLGAAMEAGIDTVVYAVRAESNGGTERVSPPSDGFFPRVIGQVRVEGSRSLLRRWHDRHPDNTFVEGLLANGEKVGT